ncbi:MAG: PAS domain S-box protein [Burkholderiales bacterium]
MLRRLWNSLRFFHRIALSSAAVLIPLAGALIVSLVSAEIERYRLELDGRANSHLSILVPAISDSAVVGDYAAIQKVLDGYSRQRGIARVSWIDPRGNVLNASGPEVPQDAPHWFRAFIATSGEETHGDIVIGGIPYGQVVVRLDATPASNQAWNILVRTLGFLVAAVTLAWAVLLVVVGRGMRPLDHLAAAARRFGEGDYSARAPSDGPPEIAFGLSAFNDMAARVEQLVASLKDSESKNRRLALIVEQSADSIIARDLDGITTLWNKGAERLYGFKAEEALGTSSHQLHLRHLSDEAFAKILETMHRGESTSFESVSTHKSGASITIEATRSPIHDEQGSVIGEVAIARDIGVRKRMENELRASEAESRRLARIVEQSTDGILTLDLDGQVTFWNKGAEQVYEFSSDEAIGKSVRSLYRRDLNDDEHDEFLGNLRAGISHSFEGERVTRTGRRIQVAGTFTPLFGEAEIVIGVIVIVRDVSEEKRLAQALTAAEARARHVIENALDAIVMVDGAGRIIDWNPEAERMFGRGKVDVLGRDVVELLSPERHRAGLRRTIEKIAVTGSSSILNRRIETPAVRQDETEFPTETSFTATRIGDTVIIAAFVRDITDRKRNEARLLESEAKNRRLALIVEQSNDAIVARDLDGLVTVWNKGAEQLFGFAAADAIGRSAHTLYLRELTVLEYDQNLEALRAGRTYQLDVTHTGDGTGGVRYLSIPQTPLLDDDATVRGAISIVHDVTKRKMVELALHDREQVMSSVLKATHEGFWHIDVNHRTLDVNPAMCTLLGRTREQILGRTVFDFVDSDKATIFQAELAARSNGKSGAYEIAFSRPDGTEVNCLINATPLFDDRGDAVGSVGLCSDISLFKQTQAALERARNEALAASLAKSEFVANMSHEIRTPMNGVLGMTGLLLKTELSERQRHFASTVQSSGVALLKVLNDVLDFSKMEAGKIEFEVIDFRFRDAVEGVVQLFAERAHAKGLELSCRIAREVPDALRGDPGRIRQVISNLLNNALKFTAEGEVRVLVQALPPAADGIGLMVIIQDTGIGIDAAVQSRIFEPFIQADSGTTRRYGGTGLGLTVCRDLVQRMGGEIGVESEPGQGSSFWFTIPLALGSYPASDAAPVALQGLHALVVDDSSTSREILALQMAGWGARVRSTANPAEALAVLHEAADLTPFRVAVMSMNSKGFNGLDLAREIRSSVALHALRIVLVSAIDEEVPAATLRALRIDRVLNKPVSESQLARCMRDVLRAAGTTADQPAVADQIAQASFTGRVLLVEDNPVNREIALASLEELGCVVDTAADGKQALDAVATRQYDMVFMDCQMPEVDGFQATAAIRARELGNGSRLPIVALTAHVMSTDRQRCLAAGMDDYMSKPFEEAQLVDMLERWLTVGAPRGGPRADAAIQRLSPSASQQRDDAGPSAPEASPKLDPEILAKLRSLGRPGKPNMLVKLAGLFFASATKEIQRMVDATVDDDRHALRSAAHTLKSASAQFGASEMNRLCIVLEAEAATGQLTTVLSQLSLLQAEYESVRVALERVLEDEQPVNA